MGGVIPVCDVNPGFYVIGGKIGIGFNLFHKMQSSFTRLRVSYAYRCSVSLYARKLHFIVFAVFVAVAVDIVTSYLIFSRRFNFCCGVVMAKPVKRRFTRMMCFPYSCALLAAA